MIDRLNAAHAIDGHLHFYAGRGDMPKVVIANQHAIAEIYLHGAHITSFQPTGQQPLLWMSNRAVFQSDKALRGGIPVIWPWFGPHPSDETKPQHGFARTSTWSVIKTEASETGDTVLQLGLTDNEMTRTIWPHAFRLELTVMVGAQLSVALKSHNQSDQPFEAGAALHTYFTVGGIHGIHLEGLDGREYLDKVTGYDSKSQIGPIRFAEEVDRIYVDTKDQVFIHDAVLERQISVSKRGSSSTVVWNPWSDKAHAMSDFPDDGYQTMVCVETTNAANDVRSIAPGENHTLTQIIGVRS